MRRRAALGTLMAGVALLGGCAAAGSAGMSRLERDVRRALVAHAPEARLLLWAGRIDGREVLAIEADRPVPAASTVKILILLEAHAQALEGTFRWADEYALRDEDQAGGSGSLQNERTGSTWTYLQMARRMIAESDNTASNILLRRLGMFRVNARAERLGLRVTRFERYFMDETARRAGRENWTTAREMGELVRSVYRKEALPPEACEAMIKSLERTSRGRIAAGVPRDLAVGHKGGSLPGYRHDVGWVDLPGAPYVLSIFLDGVIERPGSKEDRGVAAIEAISRVVYGALGPTEE